VPATGDIFDVADSSRKLSPEGCRMQKLGLNKNHSSSSPEARASISTFDGRNSIEPLFLDSLKRTVSHDTGVAS